MAETGTSRAQAMAIAREMLGEDDAGPLVLPVSERDTIRLALQVSGQWRMMQTGLGGSRPVAIDRVAIDAAARWLHITPRPEIIEGLTIIEREALRLMRQR